MSPMNIEHSRPGIHLAHSNKPVVPRDRLLRLPEVISICGIKKSMVYALLGKKQFPKPVPLSARAVAWPESAVLTWVQARIAGAEVQS